MKDLGGQHLNYHRKVKLEKAKDFDIKKLYTEVQKEKMSKKMKKNDLR